MALVGRTTQHSVPHEPGVTFTFRELSGRELDDADREGTRRALSLFEGVDKATLEAARSGETTVVADPRAGYDRDTLVKYGIVAWSYEEPCTDETKANLDAKTRDWAANIILDMNVRTPGEDGASSAS